jgi:DNA-binding transcriptional regulator PaaX
MAYLNKMKWQMELSEYGELEKKVLLALSHEKYSWRTRGRIAKSTGMSESEVDRTLEELISKDKVRASFSKKKSVIFGLRERVR